MQHAQSQWPGCSRPLHLVWVGSTAGQCARLLACLETACQHLGWAWRLSVIDSDSPDVREQLDQQLAVADRLVIAYENRYDYPHQLIGYLQSQSVIVPWGVVTGLWHAGARRTGIGPTNYWQMPWYRWWDGWCDWFFPQFARRGAWCVSQFDSLIMPVDLVASATRSVGLPRVSGTSHVLVLAACTATGEGWQLSACQAGWRATCVHPRRWDALSLDTLEPDLIVWDDSCLDRIPARRVEIHQAHEQCQRLQGRTPTVPVLVGLQQASLAEWCAATPADQPWGSAWEWLIKPSHSLPLANRLSWIERSQPMKTARL